MKVIMTDPQACLHHSPAEHQLPRSDPSTPAPSQESSSQLYNGTAATEEAKAIKQKLSSQQVVMDQARGGNPLGWQPFPSLSMDSPYTNRLFGMPCASGMVGNQPDSLPTARVVLPFHSTIPWAAPKVPSRISGMTALGISPLNSSPRFALLWPLNHPSNLLLLQCYYKYVIRYKTINPQKGWYLFN